jgi:Phage Tail Collar Domain
MRFTRQIGKYRHFRTIAEIVCAVVLLGSGATAAAAVLPSAASTTIHGCENAKTGALSARLKSSCPAGTKALSWNTTGPQGPAGTTGIFGAKTNAASGDEAASNASCYVGQILLSAGRTPPPGTLPASGQTLAINEFLALFALLGNAYGGNGTTNFKLPDLRKSAPDGLTYSICVQGAYPPSS